MSSGADLFVVCKQCGNEVSPYITECPYCGNRLRRRAPKLSRAGTGRLTRQRARMASLGRLRKNEIPGIMAERWPYATITLVALSCAGWVITRGGFVDLGKLLLYGPLRGQWWRLFSSQFVYLNGFYAFAVVLAIAIFGWLLERRHGPLVIAGLFLGASAAGGLAALALYPTALVSGADGAALALLAAWAAPDALAAFSRRHYESDLLGAGIAAATLLAMPLAREEVSWVACICGLLIGTVIGCGLGREALSGD
ncbi:MAG TPA: rhomboid family intramembrane serine protease [Solirubrobacteraceae bacterium]|jgi:membrane associated rhomboid family serine protease